MSPGQPMQDMPSAPAPLLVTQQRIHPTGNAPGRRGVAAGGDPVLGDGEFYEQRTDAQFAGFGPHFEFKRTYRSRADFRSALGFGWDHSYDKRLIGAVSRPDGDVFDPVGRYALVPYCPMFNTEQQYWPANTADGGIDYQDGELNLVHFTFISSVTEQPVTKRHVTVNYAGPPGVGLSLRQDFYGDGNYSTWTMVDADGNTLVFDALGYLSSITDVAGNKIEITWEAIPNAYASPDLAVHGPPMRINRVFDGNRTIQYNYSAAGYLQCITLGSTTCGTIAARPFDSLAYFDIDQTQGELKAVYHGQATGAEHYQYASSGVSVAVSPSDCIANEWIAPYCQRLCSAPDPLNYMSTCTNFDFPTKAAQICSTVKCQWQPNVLPPNLQCVPAKSSTPDPLCMQFNNLVPDCMTGCEKRYQCTGVFADPIGAGQYSFYSFGRPADLSHNIEYVLDEHNVTVVHNVYGVDPWDVSFDKVIRQEYEGGDSITFEYHDLNVEAGQAPIYTAPGTNNYSAVYSAPDAQYVTPKASFAQPFYCPQSGQTVILDGTGIWEYGYPVGNSYEVPASAVVVRDMHGITRTQYYDHSFNLLREVNALAQETTDYNYDPVTGFLSGVQEASGVRRCFEHDDAGHVIQTSSLPATGYAGGATPIVAAYKFDTGNQLVDEWKDVLGIRSHTHYQRDGHERIAWVDDDVNASQTPERTLYSYDENPAPFGVRETPATVTLPDGTVNTYFDLDSSMGGPTHITLDANAPIPEHRYANYDVTGRVHEEGEVGRFAMQYAYDYGRPLWVRHHTASGWPWIETDLTARDGDGITLDAVNEPQRTTTYTYRSQHPWSMTVTPKSTANGETTQTTCYNYSGDGRLSDIELPEGNERHYDYDAGGRIVGVSKGYPASAPSGAWRRPCLSHGKPAGDTGQVPQWVAIYLPGGFLSYASVGNIARGVTTDGFGRVIQTLTPNPSVVNAAAEQIGYDTRGRVVWRARLDAGHALPAAPYVKPTMTTPGLLAMEELGYDLADRVVSDRRWVIQTGEVYTVTRVYDDLNRTLTVTDRGAVTVTTFDGRGRVISRKLPDGSTTTIVHNLDNDVITQQTTSGPPLVRTVQFDTRHNTTGVLDENGKTLYSAMFDDDNRPWNEQYTGSGGVLRTFDVLGRLHVQTHDSLNGQKITETFDWDGNDRLKAQHDGNGNGWSRVLGGFDQALSTTDPTNRVTTFSYLAGYAQPSGSVDGNSRHYCYRYDTELHPAYLYDADCPASDRIIGPATPLVERRSSLYGPLGELTQIATMADAGHPTRDTVSYAYDSLGRTTDEKVDSLLDGGESYDVQRSYTNQGRTVTTSVSANLVLMPPPPATNPGLCCHGRFCGPCPPPSPILTPFVATFSNTHDIAERLTSVDFNGSRMATWSFASGIGGPGSLVYGNGTNTSFGYDNRLRQSRMTVTGPLSGTAAAANMTAARTSSSIIGTGGGGGSCPPNSFWCAPPSTVLVAALADAFGADSIPRMRQRKIGSGPLLTDVYQVDGNDRVTAENLQLPGLTLPTGEIDDSTIAPYLSAGSRWRYFAIDPDGNWSSTASAANGAVSVDQTVDALGRLTAVGGVSSTIDAQDNLQRVAGDTIAFTFEPFWGVPLTAANGNYADQISYDAANRRTTETHPDGTSTVFLWAGNQIIAHGDPANLTIDVPGDDIDSHVASVDGAGAGAARYYHAGPDQSVLAVTDGSGTLLEGYSYSVYGDVSITDANGNARSTSYIGNRFLFQGQLYDPLTATYSMRARQYSPKWGRFLSPDPLGIAAEPSLYAFTGSRPLNRRDPLGLDDTDYGSDGSILGGVFGGLLGWIIGIAEGSSNHSNGPGGTTYATLNHPQPHGPGTSHQIVPVAVPTVGLPPSAAPPSAAPTLTAKQQADAEVYRALTRVRDQLRYIGPFGPLAMTHDFLEWSGLNDNLIRPLAAMPFIGLPADGVLALEEAESLTFAAEDFTLASRGTGAFMEGVQGGAGLGKFADLSINVSQKGLTIVESHLTQFGPVEENTAMIERLENALENGIKITGADASFYMHEVAEATMMRKGMIYDVAHAAALLKYNVSQFSVYHPDVIARFPDQFANVWRVFWGIK